MAKVKKFRSYFTADDIVDVEIRPEAGDVMGSSVNYRALIRGEWIEVARYDTCHGHLRVHRRWLEQPHETQDLEDVRRPKGSYSQELDDAFGDLEENWKTYRKRMEVKK